MRTLQRLGRVIRYDCDASCESHCEIEDMRVDEARDDEADSVFGDNIPDALADDDRDVNAELKGDDDEEGVFFVS